MAKTHHSNHHENPLQLISPPPSFLSLLQFDESLERARSKRKIVVNTFRETLQRGCTAERPRRPNPSWVFSPSGAALTQIRSLQGLPHHLQAQVTNYNAETTGKYSAKALHRRQASLGCPRITSHSAFSSPLCSNCKVPDMHPQAHPTTDPPGCPSSLQGDAIAQSQGGVLKAALITLHLHEFQRASGNLRFVGISHLTFPTGNPSSW